MNLLSLFSPSNRTGRFFRTLATSYVLLGAATIYSIGLVPLLLSHGGVSDLGLMNLVVQFSAYLSLVDAGLTSCSIRQFIGPLARGDTIAFSRQFKCAWIISIFQGIIVASTGFGGPFLALWLRIPPDQVHLFSSLFLAQCFIVALGFPLRPLASVLLAKQKFEITYLVQSVALLCSLALAWFGFSQNWGLWSVIAGNSLVFILSSASLLIVGTRNGFLFLGFQGPSPSLRDVLAMLRDSSSFFSGPCIGTMTLFLQSSVLSRTLGLEGVAIWSVGSKVTSLLSQVLSKFFESSFAGMSELLELGQTQQMLRRFAQILFSATCLSFLLAAIVVLSNDWFVQFWTNHLVNWPRICTIFVSIGLISAMLGKAFSEQAKVLLYWKSIQWGPFLDLLATSLLLIPVLLSPSLLLYSLALALSPLLGSLALNCLRVRSVMAESFISHLSLSLKRATWAALLFFILAILWQLI
jgi:O-antigen/teichoic acid export membrane protein